MSSAHPEKSLYIEEFLNFSAKTGNGRPFFAEGPGSPIQVATNLNFCFIEREKQNFCAVRYTMRGLFP